MHACCIALTVTRIGSICVSLCRLFGSLDTSYMQIIRSLALLGELYAACGVYRTLRAPYGRKPPWPHEDVEL